MVELHLTSIFIDFVVVPNVQCEAELPGLGEPDRVDHVCVCSGAGHRLEHMSERDGDQRGGSHGCQMENAKSKGQTI